MQQLQNKKIRRDRTYLLEYAKKNNIVLLSDYSTIKINSTSKIEGKCLTCEQPFNKVFQQLLSTGAFCDNCGKQNKMDKIKATNIKKYGVDNPLKNPEIRAKMRATNLALHGHEYAQSDAIKEKKKATCIATYGVQSFTQSQQFKEKTKETSVKRYGVEHHMKNPAIVDKMKAAVMERYGTDCTLKVPEIDEKRKQNNLIKYNTIFPAQTEFVKNKIAQTNYARYGVNTTLKLEEVKEKIKKTMLEKYGAETPAKSKILRELMRKTCIQRYGVECVLQNEKIKEKIRATCLERYGFIFATQNPDVKAKIKQTCIANIELQPSNICPEQKKIKPKKLYNTKKNIPVTREEINKKTRKTCVINYNKLFATSLQSSTQIENENVEDECETEIITDMISHIEELTNASKPTQLLTDDEKFRLYKKHIASKISKSVYDKYGVDCVFKLEYIKEKSRKTIFDKYGVDHVAHSPEIIQKRRETCLKRYGTQHPMQNPAVADAAAKKCYRLRKYTLPSGKQINTQGYEYRALDELLKTHPEDTIIMGCKNVPHIHYTTDDGHKHVHYVDIWIPSENLMIEVKSKWTYDKKQLL